MTWWRKPGGLPLVAEQQEFERYVVSMRTLLEQMNGGLAIPAQWAEPRGDHTSAPHLSAMLSHSRHLYALGHFERARQTVGYVQGVMTVKYGLSAAERFSFGLDRREL